jgi:hypothetical protein
MQKLQSSKIEALLTKLTKGKNVSLRDLENVLGTDAVVEYEMLWAAELQRRGFFENKPTALAEYEVMLKRADLLIARAERLEAENSAKNLRLLAEAEYKAAVEYLQEMVGRDIDAKQWLDRDTYWAFEYTFNPIQVPRLVTSRSVHKLTEGASAKVSKEDIKRKILETALDKIKAEERAFAESADAIKLKGMLAKLMKQGR